MYTLLTHVLQEAVDAGFASATVSRESFSGILNL